jgi:hypothetical protein
MVKGRSEGKIFYELCMNFINSELNLLPLLKINSCNNALV